MKHSDHYEGKAEWLRNEKIRVLLHEFRFFLRFSRTGRTHGFHMGTYEDAWGFTTKDAATWTEGDDIDFHWKPAKGPERSDHVPIRFLVPMPPIASGDSTGKMAVIISGEAVGTVVKIKRTSKKGKFTAERMQRDEGHVASGPVGSKPFQVDKEDVCRVEYHGSPYGL